jgi:hypothetical protein
MRVRGYYEIEESENYVLSPWLEIEMNNLKYRVFNPPENNLCFP